MLADNIAHAVRVGSITIKVELKRTEHPQAEALRQGLQGPGYQRGNAWAAGGPAEDMQQDAIDCAAQAMEKYNIEKDIAAYIKKEFDKKYNPTWHCIVGRNFGSYVTHETKHFIYFYLGQVAILLFKSG